MRRTKVEKQLRADAHPSQQNLIWVCHMSCDINHLPKRNPYVKCPDSPALLVLLLGSAMASDL